MQAGTILMADAVVLVGAVAVFGRRLIKNYRRKVTTPDAYLIKNVASGLVIRPQNAAIEDDVPIIQYTPRNWECTTWQLIGLGDDHYLLKDLYTQKSIAPVDDVAMAGSLLAQRPIGGDPQQHWQFNQCEDGTYTIQLADTNLFITSVSDAVNERLCLQPVNGATNQRWTLTPQQPII
ncbi:RICIN domain-containing protein [Lactiplantibacillus mudanjiangensis]|uniref:Ricin B lectin domain-containing protein n=1 Tax=Lactiplantibacillus mudanjiangensis TaxID=1296538 RepID=A0A660E2S8_9LACO|nr:RICIN domain-containing protein [Lactiplantibacillus mudanjiangensis]VDG25405.1 hypothetical protein MUDAN_IGPPGNFN_03206 [Lactiplantibacillus mudanjiangensis]VDG30416.1 hypothetical protein MUDAN_MDHGFNIF_01967 [Lactiplantibacillus mudanjiangensis]VDG30802.1 hypothetical protein MUDAN_DOGOELCO_00303 [Lactiplantibacillus mudanjiangensis]